MKKKVKKQGEGGEAAQRRDETEGAPKVLAAQTGGSTRDFGGPVTDQDAPHDIATTRHITIPADLDPPLLLGIADQVLHSLERGFPRVSFHVIGRDIAISGLVSEAGIVAELVEELITPAHTGHPLEAPAVGRVISLLGQMGLKASPREEILFVRGHSICPKSEGQRTYVEVINRSTIIFGIGPAGAGKTYLVMAQAVQRLLSGEVKRIVLTRPAVETSENLGLLPGFLTDKIDPYLRPLYDAPRDILDPEVLPKLTAAGMIEVAPPAYVRGRTPSGSFIALDEAQNTTANQMKVLLARMGFNSQIVVTGDASQVDLPGSGHSGLAAIEEILHGIKGIEFCRLTSADVVRHELVGEIIDAYGRWEDRMEEKRALTSRSRTLRRTGRCQGGQG